MILHFSVLNVLGGSLLIIEEKEDFFNVFKEHAMGVFNSSRYHVVVICVLCNTFNVFYEFMICLQIMLKEYVVE